MVVVDVVGHDSARLHKIVCVESLSLQAFPFKLAGVAILLLLLWTPPLPQVTEQDDHWDHELQMQSDGLASAKILTKIINNVKQTVFSTINKYK